MERIKLLLFDSPYWLRNFFLNIFCFLLYKKRFSGSFSNYYEEYKNNLNFNHEKIENKQFELLKKNLIYCLENIEYYKKLFNENNFNPYEMKSASEIKNIPFLTKDIIKANFKKLYNKNIPKNKYCLHSTSGSTGEKLNFYLPYELMNKKNTALIYRFYSMAGVKPLEKRVTIGGKLFTNRPPYWSYNWFENQLLISSHHINKKNSMSLIKKMHDFSPAFIQGHPNGILYLAKTLTDSNYKFNLKAIFTTGETLLSDDKQIIEEAFNTKVYQQYGSGENCFSAQEAPNEKGYLINFEHGYIELVKNGDFHEVVVTSLQNNVMPFVRYKIGDFVKASQFRYSSKYNLPIMFDEVIGRTDDILTDTEGNVILPVKIRMNLKPFLFSGTNYQLIQTNNTNFKLNLIDTEKKINTKNVKQRLKLILGDDIKLSICYKDKIMSEGGKIRNIIKK